MPPAALAERNCLRDRTGAAFRAETDVIGIRSPPWLSAKNSSRRDRGTNRIKDFIPFRVGVEGLPPP